MCEQRSFLVFSERDDAEAAAEDLIDLIGAGCGARVIRETLAGEDDDEDAQWLVEVTVFSRDEQRMIDRVVVAHGGWHEPG